MVYFQCTQNESLELSNILAIQTNNLVSTFFFIKRISNLLIIVQKYLLKILTQPIIFTQFNIMIM